MESEQTIQSASAQPGKFSPRQRFDFALLSFGRTHAKLMIACQVLFQISAAGIAVFFGMSLVAMLGVAGPAAFLQTAFAGLTLQTGNLAYSNGAAAIVVLLMTLYGVLTCFLVSKGRILCDIAVLYCLFFSLTLPVFQFEILVAPAMAVYAIWFVHRVVLGTVVFRYRKLQAENR